MSTSGRYGGTSSSPEGKILIPGVVSHATNIVGHPDVVADHIIRYANVFGRENVMWGPTAGSHRARSNLT